MSVPDLRAKLRDRLSHVHQTTTGTAVSTSDSMSSSILDVIGDFLKAMDILPPKDEVLKVAGELFDEYIATRPMFAGRPFLTKITKQGLLFAVGQLYDQIDG